MADYKYEIETDFPREVFHEALGDFVIEFALGYDMASCEVVLMSVMLVSAGRAEDHIYDLQFGVRRRDAEKAWKYNSPLHFEIGECQPFILPKDRALVLGMILDCVAVLATCVEPAAITMETYHSLLPPKAMRKYHMIGTLLRTHGYEEVEAFISDAGKAYWLFQKAR